METESASNQQAVVDQFGEHAADYVHSAVHARGDSLQRLLTLTRPQAGWEVLDVATGAGHTAFAFAPQVSAVWATDITPQMLVATQNGAAERGLTNVHTETAGAMQLPFEDRRFDLVTCRIAPHHFLDNRVFVAEAGRVLKPGGKLAVVDNVVPPGPSGDFVNAFEKLRDPSHARCLTLGEWVETFQKNGFELVAEEQHEKEIDFNFWAKRHDPWMQRFLRAMLLESSPSVRSFLQPRLEAGSETFRLTEGILVGVK